MANFVFNVAKGAVAEKVRDGATIRALVLKEADTDDAHRVVDSVEALLALGGVTEADFTNYARATIADPEVTVDDVNHRVDVDGADITFLEAGGLTNNTCTDLVIYEDVDGTDANAVPLVQLDAVFTTDGNDVTLQFAADGFYRAS